MGLGFTWFCTGDIIVPDIIRVETFVEVVKADLSLNPKPLFPRPPWAPKFTNPAIERDACCRWPGMQERWFRV